MKYSLNKINILDLLKIAQEAGKAILKVYDSDFGFESKKDGSPLTLADKNSFGIISKALAAAYLEIPLLSEEGKEIPYETRKSWKAFWLVDPLDGTKEFIQRNGQFTVNIALIDNGKPVLGIIHAPVKDIFYFAKEGLGTYKLEDTSCLENAKDINTIIGLSTRLPFDNREEKLAVVASRSHSLKETDAYIDKLKEEYKEMDIINIGSSLKLCLIAEGKAHVYPRFGPTMEWDIAAGQVLIEQTAGSITSVENKQALQYNKDSLVNPRFVASSGEMCNMIKDSGKPEDYLVSIQDNIIEEKK